jgi:hypothetical protein
MSIGTAGARSIAMTPDDLKARTKKCAIHVITFAGSEPQDPIHNDIASQLTDAATSTAAHYRARLQGEVESRFHQQAWRSHRGGR